jgi:3-phenylpropionate/trans-cinnamate dioxygenase ferredoxin subunit
VKHVVAALDEIPPGGRKIVEVAGRSIGVFNLGGEFFALRNRCPHQGAPLCEGRVWGALESSRPGEFKYTRGGEILACIWHGWEFDIRTGQSWCDPRRLRVKLYEVEVEPGAAVIDPVPGPVGPGSPDAPAPGMVKGPYLAETYPVTREGEYLVVEIVP